MWTYNLINESDLSYRSYHTVLIKRESSNISESVHLNITKWAHTYTHTPIPSSTYFSSFTSHLHTMLIKLPSTPTSSYTFLLLHNYSKQYVVLISQNNHFVPLRSAQWRAARTNPHIDQIQFSSIKYKIERILCEFVCFMFSWSLNKHLEVQLS